MMPQTELTSLSPIWVVARSINKWRKIRCVVEKTKFSDIEMVKFHRSRDLKQKGSNRDAISEIEDRNQNKRPERQILYANAVRSGPSPQARPRWSYNEATLKKKNSEDAEGYKKAYIKEYEQLIDMKTWNPDKPIDETLILKLKIINDMYIFTTKRDGTRKCRLVARGDQQKAGTYQENLKAKTVHHYALMTSLKHSIRK